MTDRVRVSALGAFTVPGLVVMTLWWVQGTGWVPMGMGATLDQMGATYHFVTLPPAMSWVPRITLSH